MATHHFKFLLVLLISLFWHFPLPTKADNFATYSAFVRCMQKNTNPSDNIGSLIHYSANSSFPSVLSDYSRNKRFETASKPLLIVTAKQIPHLQATVVCAQRAAPAHTLKIRSGGHDYDGLSYTATSPFLILDMFNLRSVSIDPASKTAWVQTGATLGEVYYAISKASNLLGFPAGVCPTVGVGGHVSGGGYGNMIRKYGLTVDNVVDAQVVDVNGRLLNRATMGEDFFWAIRGGGGASFGVVVSYKINLVAVPATVTVFRLEQYADENAAGMLSEWQNVAPTTTDDLFMRVLLQQASSRKTKGGKTIKVSVLALYLGGADSLVQLLGSQLPELGLTKADCKEMTWIQSVLWWANFDPTQSPTVLLNRSNTASYIKRKSDYVTAPISAANLNAMFDKLASIGKMGMVFNAYGGKMAQISPTATPFAHRAGFLFKIQYSLTWKEGGSAADDDNIGRMREMYSFMTPLVSKNPRSSFFPYRDVDIGVMEHNSVAVGRVYGEKYFGGNFNRLVKIKSAVDPKNFFHNEQSIPAL